MISQLRTQRILVDGETWEVVEHDGGYACTWLSGVDPGYGFSSKLNDPGARLSLADLEASIRDFMSNVNHDTGHLD